jgi:hypothetical protein
MDTHLLPCRLKSARRKKRLQKEDRDKQILKLDRERKRILNDPDYKTVVQLAEPYQRGWMRLFVLKPGIQKSERATFYQGILDQINTVQYHYDESFKKRQRKGRWHRYYFEELPKLQSIDRYNWDTNKHKLSEGQRGCFEQVEFWDDRLYAISYKYTFAHPHLFEIKVLPHIISTIKETDVLLEQRLSFIDDYLERDGLANRLSKLKGGRNKYWKGDYDEKTKFANPLKNRPKWDVFEE